jgi:hypothetical protein
MTVLIYVDISQKVGDPDHLQVFAKADAAGIWFEETILRAWALRMRLWNVPDSQLHAAQSSLTGKLN